NQGDTMYSGIFNIPTLPALAQALDALHRDGITFAVARAGDHLKANLARGGLVDRIGADRFYASVDAAVTGAGLPHRTRGEA
ncbi:MAG: hypothetical protein WAU75_09975, partial [Solirubrobacteraceae bacterium]